MPALKSHINKNHRQKKHRCSVCGFESGEAEMEDHNKEFHLVHQNIRQQKKRMLSVFGCDQCGVAVGDEHKLKNHEQSQHPVSSPEPSPPRKKPVKDVELVSVQDVEVKDVEVQATKTEMLNIDQMDTNHSEVKLTPEDNTKEVNKEVQKKQEIITAQDKTIKAQEN